MAKIASKNPMVKKELFVQRASFATLGGWCRTSRFIGIEAAALAALLISAFFSPMAHAQGTVQTPGVTPDVTAALPDAPEPQSTGLQSTGLQSTDPSSSGTRQAGSISGTVKDTSGAPVVGAQVTVVGKRPPIHRSLAVDNQGNYTFTGLPGQSYTVTVMAPEMEPVKAVTVPLGKGEAYKLPITATAMPKFTSTVRVTASPVQIATAQVHQQEKQRVLGVIPNFYTSYVWNAAPMTSKLKYHLLLRSSVDPITIAGAAGVAGVEQWQNIYPGYGGGWAGYGQRFGASYADTLVSRFFGDALLPAVFHQDPRYFYRGSGSWGRRTAYALEESLMTRGDSGKQQFAYSRVLGAFIAAGFSNVYHSPQDRSAGATFRDGAVIVGADAVENVLREFLSRSLTSHVPGFENGKKTSRSQ